MSIEILMIPIIFILVTIYSFFNNKIIFWINIIFIVIAITAHIIFINSIKLEEVESFFPPVYILLILLGFILLPIIELFIIQFSFAWRQKQTGNSNTNRSKNNMRRNTVSNT